MIKILTSLAIATALFTTPVQAASIQPVSHISMAPGLEISVIGYCRGKKAAEGLSAAIALGGRKIFYEFLQDQKTSCFLVGLNQNIKPVRGTVTGKAWEVTDPDGALFEFWSFKDGAGDIGYTWQNMSTNTVKTKGRKA